MFSILKEVIGFTNNNPETTAMHFPILPSSGEEISYKIRRINGIIETVELHIKLNDSNKEFIKKFNWQNDSKNDEISFPYFLNTKDRDVITYWYEVKGNSNTYKHEVSFTINHKINILNLSKENPIPVYKTNYSAEVINVVFIPDKDIENITNFHLAVSEQIQNIFHAEPTLKRFRSCYNFFINPATAIAGDFENNTYREIPVNSAVLSKLSDAVILLILHETVLTDYSSSYSSAELNEYGAVVHEIGHSAFGLKDEYTDSPFIGISNPNFKYHNNWERKNEAIISARYYGKDPEKNVVTIVNKATKKEYFKICDNTCAMKLDGDAHNLFVYDTPCIDVVIDAIARRFKCRPISIYGIKFLKSLFQSLISREVTIKNKIEEINNFIDKNKFTVIKKEKETSNHISIRVEKKNNEYSYNNSLINYWTDKFPYTKGSDGVFYIKYKNKMDELVCEYIIDDPSLIRITKPKCSIVYLENYEFDLFIPLNKDIKRIEFIRNGFPEIPHLDVSDVDFDDFK